MNAFVQASMLHANLPQANFNDLSASSPLKISHTPAKTDDTLMKTSASLGSPSRKSRKKRTKITEEQLALLKVAYEENCIPDYGEREILAERTGLSIRVVQVWFQNRRAYQKRNKDMKANNNTAVIGVANGAQLSKSNSCDVLNMPQFGDISESSADSSPKNILGYSNGMDASYVRSKLSSMSSPMLNLSTSLPQSMMLERKLNNSGKNKSKVSKTHRNSGSRSKRNTSMCNSPLNNDYGVEHGAELCLSDYDTGFIKRRFSSTTVAQPVCFSLKNESLQRSQSLTTEDCNSFLHYLSCGISNYQELDMNDVSSVMSKRSDPMINMDVDESLENRNNIRFTGQQLTNFASSGSLSYADSTGLSRVQSYDTLNDGIFPMTSNESNAAMKAEVESGYIGGDLFSMDFDFNVGKGIGINIDNIVTSTNDDLPMHNFLDGLIATDN